MAVYLVQHGLSLPKDEDPERGLSEAGIADVKRIAAVAKDYEVPVASISTVVKNGHGRPLKFLLGP